MNTIFFKISAIIITAFFFFAGLYYTQQLLIPLLFAILLAMLFLPLCRWLEKSGVNQTLAILICLLTIIVIIGSLLFLFYSQTVSLVQDFPLFKEKALVKFKSLQNFVEDMTHFSAEDQMEWITKNYSKGLSFMSSYASAMLLGITGGLAIFALILLYIFFLLSLRGRIKNFVLKLFNHQEHEHVKEIINKTENLIQHYMMGLFIEFLLVGTLNSIGFLILGLKQAIFFGFLLAILNVIPYIGGLIGPVFPIFIALVYKDSLIYVAGVLGVVLVVQFIDNHFITPKIVGGYVRLNPLATIIVILIGGSLWGISGMMLFLPLLGVVKIICDNIPPLQPLGYLLGEDEKPASGFGTKIKNFIERKIKKA